MLPSAAPVGERWGVPVRPGQPEAGQGAQFDVHREGGIKHDGRQEDQQEEAALKVATQLVTLAVTAASAESYCGAG
jgi:hypothetical protein